MGGGLMQLVAYGAQDIYLTGNPQITFFKVVYRRHTNFSMELIEQTLNGTVSASSRVTATISRNGDLIHDMYYKIKAGAKIVAASGDNPGHNMIDNVECEIGGQQIDKHYGHWMEVWSQLTEENPGNVAPSAVADTPPAGHTKFQRMALAGGVNDGNGTRTLENSHWVPLQFWFCRNVGLALPLIALQYHEVKIVTTFSACLGTGADTLDDSGNISLWTNYIYLDTDERRRFAQVSHEYLIEQVQFQLNGQGSTGADSYDLNFNHPVKELIWAGVAAQAWGAANAGAGTFKDVIGGDWQLKLNGHDRFAAQDSGYFARQQVWKHHSGFGGIITQSIAVYSFALKPEEHQPSGTCNFSRIDNAQLKASAATDTLGVYIYAVNYNVLRIMSGMGGLAYSN
jgi:hypothetical protein